LGSDHIAAGSDHPFGIGPEDRSAIVREAPDLTDQDWENILYCTAEHLLGVRLGRSNS
jgi:hypothetical protein